MSSIFTKIINQKIPSYKIYENDLVYSFLDINPINLGHTLIVPKVEIDCFEDVLEPYYSEVFKVAKYLAKALKSITRCKRVYTLIAGDDVPHFHYHLIPGQSLTDIDFKKTKTLDPSDMHKVQSEILDYIASNPYK